MSLSILPSLVAETVTQLTPAYLQQEGIALLMLDFDNTIVPYTTSVPSPEMEQWLRQMTASPVRLCVVSNSRKSRVRAFCAHYGIACITHAKKPFSRGIRACLAQFQLPPQACALAGDQIFTDTLGANCAGVRSILVDAIHNHTFLLKLRGCLEVPFRLLSRKRTILPR